MPKTNNLVRSARKEAGLSQKDLRALLATYGVVISQPTLSHYETGKRAPGSMEEIVALAGALAVEPDALAHYFADLRADYARTAYLEKLVADQAAEVLHG